MNVSPFEANKGLFTKRTRGYGNCSLIMLMGIGHVAMLNQSRANPGGERKYKVLKRPRSASSGCAAALLQPTGRGNFWQWQHLAAATFGRPLGESEVNFADAPEVSREHQPRPDYGSLGIRV